MSRGNARLTPALLSLLGGGVEEEVDSHGGWPCGPWKQLPSACSLLGLLGGSWGAQEHSLVGEGPQCSNLAAEHSSLWSQGLAAQPLGGSTAATKPVAAVDVAQHAAPPSVCLPVQLKQRRGWRLRRRH